MITEIKISNFKAIGEQISIPIRPITLLFGANSSGKSSIIQCLMMLAQSIGKDITPKGQHVDTGSFQNFIFKNDKERIFEIQFTIDIHENLFIEILRDHPKRDEYDWQELLNETTRSLINSLSDFTTASVCFRFKYDSNQAVNLFEIDFFLDQHQHEKPLFSYLTEEEECIYNTYHLFWHSYLSCFGKSIIKTFPSIPDEAMHGLINDLETTSERKKRISQILTALVERDLRASRALLILELQRAVDNFTVSSELGFNEDHQDGFAIELDRIIEQFHVDDKEEVPSNWEISNMVDYLDDIWGSSIDSNFPPTLFGYEQHSVLNMMTKGRKQEYSDSSQELPEPLQFVLMFSSPIKRLLGSLFYHGPIRDMPLRYYSTDTNSYNLSIFADPKQNLLMTLAKDSEVLQQVNQELIDLKSRYQIGISRLINDRTKEEQFYSLEFIDKYTDVKASIKDVGYGFSQILPILVSGKALYKAIVCIEQPELHLHPAMQADLGDFFIRSTKLSAFSNAFLIETHSEHLILRILRRIRNTTMNNLPKNVPPIYPEDVAVLYVEPDSKGAKVTRIPIDKDGDFETDWPHGFFTEREQELFD